MTCAIRTVLDLPDKPNHEAVLVCPQSQYGRQRKTFRALREGGKAENQHSIGVHVYSRRWPGGAWDFRVRWSNGLIRKNGTGFVGRVYFDALSIQLRTDENLVLVPEARVGQTYDATSGAVFVAHGGGHEFQPRGMLERDFLAVPKTWTKAQIEDLVEKVLRFRRIRFPTKEAYVWGPARERMPTVDRAHYATLFGNGLAQARQLVATGAKGSVRLGPSGTWSNLDLRGALGPYIPDGDPQAGAPAGYEIELAFGWPQVPEALALSKIAHECSMSRNSIAANDLDTGEQLSVHDWPFANMGQPQLMAGEPGVQQGRLEIPAFCVGGYPNYRYPVFNAGFCPYQGALEGYQDDDTEHVIRALDDAAFLAFSGGDLMALDDLHALMEHHRHMRWSDRADEPTSGGHWLKSTTRLLKELMGRQHKGHSAFLRSYGWMLTLATLCGEKAFARRLVEAFLLAVDSCGIAQREYHPPYMPPDIQGTQHFHNAIDQAAVLRACRMIGDQDLTDRVLDAIRVWVAKVVLNPATKGVAKWIHRQRGDGSEIDPITAADRGPEVMAEHCLAVLGLAALCEIDAGDKVAAKAFLDAGLHVDVGHGNLQQRLTWIRAKTADLSQYASYAAAIEALG